jgi:ribonuclease HII
MLAMQRAVAALAIGRKSALMTQPLPAAGHPGRSAGQGDGKIASIAAASILAKTVRDAGMLELHVQYPQYGFDRHMGYPTAAHCAALAEHGASPVHRRSFGPVARQLALL